MGIGFIIELVKIIFEVYTWLIIARIILSWVPHNPYNPIIRFVYEITQPVLGLFQRFIPPIGMIDFSPIVAFIALELAKYFIITILTSLFLG